MPVKDFEENKSVSVLFNNCVENEAESILVSLMETMIGAEKSQKCECEWGRGGGGDRMESFAKQNSRCQCLLRHSFH